MTAPNLKQAVSNHRRWESVPIRYAKRCNIVNDNCYFPPLRNKYSLLSDLDNEIDELTISQLTNVQYCMPVT